MGLDLAEDEFENDQPSDEQPRWEISERVAGLVLGRGGSLWERLSGSLDALEIDLRVRVVDQLARYLTYKQGLFLPESFRFPSGGTAGASSTTTSSGIPPRSNSASAGSTGWAR